VTLLAEQAVWVSLGPAADTDRATARPQIAAVPDRDPATVSQGHFRTHAPQQTPPWFDHRNQLQSLT
jgi:hypothetical protein